MVVGFRGVTSQALLLSGRRAGLYACIHKKVGTFSLCCD